MATNEEVLRSFLVSLNWRNEIHQQKEFVGAIEGATLKANLLADGIRSMAESIAGSLSSASQNFLQLGVLANNTRTSISTILAFQQTLTQFGGTAGEAASTIQTISNNLRSMNDGNLSYFEKFGFHQNKVTGEITANLADAKKALDGMSDAAVAQFAHLAGIPETLAYQLKLSGDKMQAAFDKAKETLKHFGIDQNVVDSQTEYKRKLNDVYFDLQQVWGRLTTAIEKPITPGLAGFDKWLNDHGDEIGKALDQIGVAFDNDVISPLLAMGPATDPLADDAKKINDFKDSVIVGLDGIKDLLETIKTIFIFVDNLSNNIQRWGDELGKLTGLTKVGPALFNPSQKELEAQKKYGLSPLLEQVLPKTPENPAWWAPQTWGQKFDPTKPEPALPTPPHLPTVVPTEKERSDQEQVGAIVGEMLGKGSGRPQPRHPESRGENRGWSLFNPRTWFGGDAKASPAGGSRTDKANQNPTNNLPPLDANKPTRNATPEEAEVRGGGFRIPGTDQSIGFGDQTVTLKTGGTVVQSGNPLPVRIEKIDPTASGIGGVDGLGGTGISNSLRGSSGRSRFANYLHGEGVSPGEGSKVQQPEAAGKYRPVYKPGDKDLSDKVVDTIAGEASTRNPAAIDAVINNMFNRLGTRGYGPSGNLEEVARSQGESGRQPQYTGYRQTSAQEAEFIRSRIKAIASGGMPDTTKRSMEYRGAYLYNEFARRHPEGVGVGGNWFFPTGAREGPYRAYDKPHEAPSPPHTPTPSISSSNIKIPNVYHGSQSSEYPAPTEKVAPSPTSWLGLDKNAQRWMASNWGGDTVHHHYDNSDSSTTHNNHQKINVTVNGATEPHEIARAVGSTLDMSFSPSQAKQRFLQGAIA